MRVAFLLSCSPVFITNEICGGHLDLLWWELLETVVYKWQHGGIIQVFKDYFLNHICYFCILMVPSCPQEAEWMLFQTQSFRTIVNGNQTLDLLVSNQIHWPLKQWGGQLCYYKKLDYIVDEQWNIISVTWENVKDIYQGLMATVR